MGGEGCGWGGVALDEELKNASGAEERRTGREEVNKCEQAREREEDETRGEAGRRSNWFSLAANTPSACWKEIQERCAEAPLWGIPLALPECVRARARERVCVRRRLSVRTDESKCSERLTGREC